MPKYKISLPSSNPPLRRGIREGREGEGRRKKIKKKINKFFPFGFAFERASPSLPLIPFATRLLRRAVRLLRLLRRA